MYTCTSDQVIETYSLSLYLLPSLSLSRLTYSLRFFLSFFIESRYRGWQRDRQGSRPGQERPRNPPGGAVQQYLHPPWPRLYRPGLWPQHQGHFPLRSEGQRERSQVKGKKDLYNLIIWCCDRVDSVGKTDCCYLCFVLNPFWNDNSPL